MPEYTEQRGEKASAKSVTNIAEFTELITELQHGAVTLVQVLREPCSPQVFFGLAPRSNSSPEKSVCEDVNEGRARRRDAKGHECA